jgi:hypothetical protein
MNYQNIYNSLIQKRLKEPATGYTEKHHIIPKSLGGSDDLSNLVVLSGREHWVAHLLLYKIHKCSKMAHACNMMSMRCNERGIPKIRNSRMYQMIRTICIENMRFDMSIKQKGDKNSQYGTIWICNKKLQQNRKISKDEQIPNGWIKGRNKWVPKWRPTPGKTYTRNKKYTKTCKTCQGMFKTTLSSQTFCSKTCIRPTDTARNNMSTAQKKRFSNARVA